MEYQKEMTDFIKILNNTALETIELYEEIYITTKGNQLVISSADWIGEDPEEYIFNGGYDEYIELSKTILKRVYEIKIGIASDYLFLKEIDRYIKDFAKRLKNEWEIFRDVSLQHIPIKTTIDANNDDNGDYSGEIGGFYQPGINLITIYNVSKINEETSKRTARHEVIHFMLFSAELPFDDDTALFWTMAERYDAHPYKEITNDAEKALYPIFKNMSNNQLDELWKSRISQRGK